MGDELRVAVPQSLGGSWPASLRRQDEVPGKPPHHLNLREVDVHALARRLAAAQGGDHESRSERPAKDIRKEQTGTGRRAVTIAKEGGEPAHLLNSRPVCDIITLRPSLSEPGKRDHHNARVDLTQLVVANTQLWQHAWREVFDDHVGVPGEPQEDVLAQWVVEFEGETSLVPVALVVEARAVPWLIAGVAVGVGTHARRWGDGRAPGVQPASRLDLDDVGTEVGEQPA